ncbi:phage antirepressor N-terminal domain-containing protein [Giesbergeria anulus]|uniref:P22_AR N-terminal domain-containing protein n=1 Tax=Giesbergeria anulus TaxID=180197 RepID=A0A1H9RMI5_9BURK|nr:phage antirepressor N-terminal domain-containing protein [Giesbergeria anulus]SER73926.1 P22_AR N-terminal domain-containing protein [Giesbergeria anulus]
MSQNQLVSVEFHGQSILATLNDGKPYVAMKPICENIGLQWEAQQKRIQRNHVLAQGMSMMDMVAEDGKQRKMICLPLTMLNGWLFGVDVNRVRPELRDKLMVYQRECFDVLFQHFMPQPAPTQRPYNPAIDYTRISPSQAQDIKELVHQVVDSGVQTFGETWNRLHNKFRVNSYLELPATKYDEVCAYLRGKLPPVPAPAPAPKPAPAPQPSFITKSVFISPTAMAKCIELRDDGSKQGVSFASNLLGEIQFALMFNGSAAHTRLTVSSAREMGNALLEVADAQAALERRAASAT